MEAGDLIERYVHEEGQKLPRKTRKDIELELSSLLMDDLEQHAAAQDTSSTVELAAEILQEYGKPKKMAARYQ